MNVLVTGSLGHIGSRIIRDLAEVNEIDEIILFDNFSTQRYCSLFNLPKNGYYRFIEGDIRKKKDLLKATKNIDLVFHFAALTDAPSTVKKPALTKLINLNGTKNVVQACIVNGVKKIIYPSTTSVYGPCNGVVTEEWSECNPQSPYALYKYLGESEILKAAEDSEIEGIVLRLGTIFGTSIGMRFHTAVNKFVYQACMGIPLTVWENALNQKRPYLDLFDCSRVFIFMINKKEANGQIYNVPTSIFT